MSTSAGCPMWVGSCEQEPLPRYEYEHRTRLCGRMNGIRAASIYIAGGEGNKGLHEAHRNASAHRVPRRRSVGQWAASAP
jgi:hypothetical protein